MKQSTPWAATFGLIFLIGLIPISGCGDDGKSEPSTTDSPTQTTAPASEEPKIDPDTLARTSAIRDQGLWRINVTLPENLPDGAKVAAVTCTTKDESHTWEKWGQDAQIMFLLASDTIDYEVLVTDDKKRTYKTKASTQ